MGSITPTEVGSFFLSLVVPVATGVVAAWFTARFALGRFYHEKWWDKKHSAYNELIDNLYELRDFFRSASLIVDQEQHHMVRAKIRDEEKLNWARYYELYSILRKRAVLSPITLGAETQMMLEEFFKTTADKNQQVYQEGWPREIAYEEMSVAMDKIINAVVADAKTELRFK
ncbi:hypothetical protein [Citrobacter portucalensis]|uniref:hypothetical protein n=1 Tax=Citrobacter portucalensis TaxID=1639133 RepID=UPI0018A92E95|nr:hypothetical protein [Citrobacter portucalensis]MCC2943075.1 hypothetical protein [Citrobacter freundii]UKK87424.1 hypothetical protein L6310_17835 [Citrobacter portucalensis]HCL5537444.1 hypothetical protein [Citrobacter werkmanii]